MGGGSASRDPPYVRLPGGQEIMTLMRTFVLALGCAAAAFNPAPAWAQAVQVPRIQLPTIIVTAQKEPADAQTLPVSVTAVSMDTLINAGVTLVRGDLRAIAAARTLSRATVRNIRQNLVFAFGYNVAGVPIAAGVLYPFFGLLLSPMLAGAAMSLSSVSVIANALRLRRARL